MQMQLHNLININHLRSSANYPSGHYLDIPLSALVSVVGQQERRGQNSNLSVHAVNTKVLESEPEVIEASGMAFCFQPQMVIDILPQPIAALTLGISIL